MEILLIRGALVAQWVRSLDLTAHASLSPIRRRFAPSFVNYKKGCTRLAAASNKVYQLLAQGRWFSSGTLASSTTKTGRHDIAEILLTVALNTKNSNSNYINQLVLVTFLKQGCRFLSWTFLCSIIWGKTFVLSILVISLTITA